MQTLRVSLAPSPGFCIKSVSLQDAVCKITPPPPPASSKLEGPSVIHAVPIPKGAKIFVNIAWDRNVPPPPEGSEDVIQRAMLGEDPSDGNDQDWFVPVVVSEPREDRDKAGKPSVVFDCVYNSTLKSRALKDPEFKTFLIELAFQRIEAQHGVLLSRQIGTPNIRSKGELLSRTVLIPAALFPENSPARKTSDSKAESVARKLIEEVDPRPTPPQKSTKDKPDGQDEYPTAATPGPTSLPSPDFLWSRGIEGVHIYVLVPKLTHSRVQSATLDIEPRRIIFHVPDLYALDLNLDMSDAEIGQNAQLSEKTVDQALTLKRQREFDVDRARAQWNVAEGQLIIHDA
ncbi:uncharacterized protein FIBRA_05352 [Fibroporia radiculosa]|uniref:PIH1 N-terminal domain-containing protein n=1 Tax=Fibroporia radiculosa TaxID=599839 RepID=J4HXD4_9APHY|nr:uncharacterized protein FIBRA_05352 [Fibroporia radiculosa]CCM03227.1 predicted protein [Fibroporia radiculosa]